MIAVTDNQFSLHTRDTSYLFHLLPTGQLEHLYYGGRCDTQNLFAGLHFRNVFATGNTISYDEAHPEVNLERLCLEYSSLGKGDIRQPMVELTFPDGSETVDFIYQSHVIEALTPLDGLPSAYDETGETETLVITLVDRNHPVTLTLRYSVFFDCNVIVRSASIGNDMAEPITVHRLLSSQLDFDRNHFTLHSWNGAWVREMCHHETACTAGIVLNQSLAGTSSSRANPFTILSAPHTTETAGLCYGSNLIYSGNHQTAVEVDGYQNTRYLCGMNPQTFQYRLAPSACITAPQCVLTCSTAGLTALSHNMHHFVREHIVRGPWKRRERPVLLNSWEASYFKFNESKLLTLAKAAQKVGIELFVLDDGWFGYRNDENSSLGDWVENTKKLPSGLAGLAEKINQLGMDFGIWVEPEMVSEDSDCYRNHPDFAVKIPNQSHAHGRHQMILDLTQRAVQDYIIAEMRRVFSSANISYVKWDMNRILSDCYSQALPPERQREFHHRYQLGLSRILATLTEEFPHILFEGCASGGNRSDLGMLCYMPQLWASDNTDAICRGEIQTGYSYGYPMSVLSAHVSSCPNHQTLRQTPLDTRFQVAAFGLLGYEYNLSDCDRGTLDAITAQIAWYQSHRRTLQFGDYYRQVSGDGGSYQWNVVSEDKKECVALFLQTLTTPNPPSATLALGGLNPTEIYRITNRPLTFDLRQFGDLVNHVAPVHVRQDGLLHRVAAQFVAMESEREDFRLTGDALNQIGLRLAPAFAGTGYDSRVRFFPDFASRLYLIEQQPSDVAVDS